MNINVVFYNILKGCVQEEIRFLINTELLITRLFTAKLLDNEVIIITGAERYCNYTGYSDTFQFAGNFNDNSPRYLFVHNFISIFLCFMNIFELTMIIYI